MKFQIEKKIPFEYFFTRFTIQKISQIYFSCQNASVEQHFYKNYEKTRDLTRVFLHHFENIIPLSGWTLV